MKEEIERATSVLIGKALWKCTRAADMACFAFGAREKALNFRGEPKEVGEFALHVQCGWRIAQEDRVVVGQRDLYYPADYNDEEGIPETFSWDRDPNLQDKLFRLFFQDETREFTVQAIQVGPAGSLHIALSGLFYLDILPDDSLGRERWLLFRPGKDKNHFVVTGNDITLVQ